MRVAVLAIALVSSVVARGVAEEGHLVIRGGGGALTVDSVYGDILPGVDGGFRADYLEGHCPRLTGEVTREFTELTL